MKIIIISLFAIWIVLAIIDEFFLAKKVQWLIRAINKLEKQLYGDDIASDMLPIPEETYVVKGQLLSRIDKLISYSRCQKYQDKAQKDKQQKPQKTQEQNE